ncbi:MAG: GNAT family N-acetyltransferase [Acidimicrobiia bacterium]|nr:GNAT family N-acetyltransferase [Acidimicrobiia bacterium]
MALADTPPRVFQRGTWPGSVSLRRGWARAEARPWNDAVDDATLRLIRGGSGFLEACVYRLIGLGAPSILSSPLAPSARRPWENAGFRSHIDLALMRLSLQDSIAAPTHLVVREDDFDLDLMLDIDRAAFPDFWRFDRAGLVESTQATGSSSVFVIRDGNEGITGYAVVGYGHAISYLQRVAVHPQWQGEGMGRSLVRASARSAKRNGSKAMLLNTQFDNDPAITLYEDEGFVTLPESLAVLRAG